LLAGLRDQNLRRLEMRGQVALVLLGPAWRCSSSSRQIGPSVLADDCRCAARALIARPGPIQVRTVGMFILVGDQIPTPSSVCRRQEKKPKNAVAGYTRTPLLVAGSSRSRAELLHLTASRCRIRGYAGARRQVLPASVALEGSCPRLMLGPPRTGSGRKKPCWQARVVRSELAWQASRALFRV